MAIAFAKLPYPRFVVSDSKDPKRFLICCDEQHANCGSLEGVKRAIRIGRGTVAGAAIQTYTADEVACFLTAATQIY